MYGTTAGEPYMKHLEGEIWELRPLRDRILFFCYNKGAFILLNCFMKKNTKNTQKGNCESQKTNE
ncbi:MAG: type II toxin-antitoxin system RelE/ParE family toxin [Roseburia sp.]|nr:type II toxin-antitoxin system RelE/ParE family toxin [Roseburia sp.]MCM1243462.1 type II toxin-antitoxin system RelE/ParE family toxin [Roseburia sp.]